MADEQETEAKKREAEEPARKAKGRRAPKIATLIAVTVAFGALPPLLRHERVIDVQVWLWSLSLGALVIFSLCWLIGNPILDERKRWSLSRFQILLWTWLVLSSLWGMFVIRMFANVADPLALEIDEHLWMLMGISCASFVGSSLIMETKETKGIVAKGKDGGEVRDLFCGEDMGNAKYVDLGRVQMFFFTAVAAIAFFAACLHAVDSAKPAELVFPKLSDGLLALLGISHATYLGNKLPDRKPADGGTPQ